VAACAGDGQIWDISTPENPTASDGEPHTHIPDPNPTTGDRFEFVHNAVVTWDGRYFGLADETGGSGTAECDGSAPEGTPPGASSDGFYYFYEMVDPGEPAGPPLSRYMIPRPQGTEICVSQNGNFIPTNQGYAVVADMTGDGRDSPPPLLQRCDLHVFLWCQHRGRAPLQRRCGLGRPPALGGAPPRRMDAQKWGDSVSRSGEIRVSVVTTRVDAGRRHAPDRAS